MNLPVLTFADMAERFEATVQNSPSNSFQNYATSYYSDYYQPETRRSITKTVLTIVFVILMAVVGYLIFHNLERIKKWLIVKLSEKQDNRNRLEVCEKS